MTQTQEYIYLNSVYSIFDNETKYHKFNLNKPIIAHGNNIQIRLSEAEIPVSYYNVISGVMIVYFLRSHIQEIMKLIMTLLYLRKIMMQTKWKIF